VSSKYQRRGGFIQNSVQSTKPKNKNPPTPPANHRASIGQIIKTNHPNEIQFAEIIGVIDRFAIDRLPVGRVFIWKFQIIGVIDRSAIDRLSIGRAGFYLEILLLCFVDG
jgi:hypothetical protein